MSASRHLAALILIGGLATGCSSSSSPSGPPGPRVATVEFVYRAAVATDPAVREAFPACVGGVGETHIHPGWHGFARTDMSPSGADAWRIMFTDVPVGQELAIRVSDPNVCADNPTGAATESVFANGVLLTRVVPTPGSGTEPGLALSVAADGTVSP